MIQRKAPLRRSTKKGKPTKRSTEKNRADKLWAAKVKAPYAEAVHCELSRWHSQFPCAGPMQAAHGFSRRYLGTRYLPMNGFALCRSGHVYWTHRPLEWDQVLRVEWGEHAYEEMRQRALNFVGPLDYRLIADALR